MGLVLLSYLGVILAFWNTHSNIQKVKWRNLPLPEFMYIAACTGLSREGVFAATVRADYPWIK